MFHVYAKMQFNADKELCSSICFNMYMYVAKFINKHSKTGVCIVFKSFVHVCKLEFYNESVVNNLLKFLA